MQRNTMQNGTLKVVSHVYEHNVSTSDHWDKSIFLMEHALHDGINQSLTIEAYRL